MHVDTDELDLQLLGVLQYAPRISWAAAEGILRVSAATLANRWNRLSSAGLAWITVYPDPMRTGMLLAYVDVDCAPGQVEPVVEAVLHDPRVVSIDECAGEHELLLVVMVRNLAELSALLFDDLPPLSGVTGLRTRIVTAVHTEGARWRLDSLDVQRKHQAMTAGEVPRRPLTTPMDQHWPLVEALTREPRMPIACLARATDLTPSTAGRHLAELIGSGALAIRLDTAPGVCGWETTCSWMGQLPLGARAKVVDRLCRQPVVRICMSTTGPSNLAWTISSPSPEAIGRFEEAMGAAMPSLAPTESLVHLRVRKKLGCLIDASGRATGEVIVPTALAPLA